MSTPQTPSSVNFIQAPAFILSGSGASIGDTTITLQSMEDNDGNQIVTADLGSFAFATLEPGNGTQEEAILFTGVTQNANGTATLTGVSSVAFKQPYTVTTGLTKTHPGASKLILSNDAAFYNNFTLYLNDIAGAGAANASTAVKGIVQAGTQAQVNAGTATGSTGAVLTVTPDVLVNSENWKYITAIKNTSVPYAVASGTPQAYTATLATSLISTLASGTSINLLVPTTNATSVTLNINGLGAKTITKNVSTTLASGDMPAGSVSHLVYDGTNFQIPPKPKLICKTGTFTKDVGDANGATTTITHGLGTTPSLFRVTLLTNASTDQIQDSVGTYDGTNYARLFTTFDISSAASYGSQSTSDICLISRTGNFLTEYQTAAVSTFNATSVILTWTKTGSPTGSYTLMWEAIGQ